MMNGAEERERSRFLKGCEPSSARPIRLGNWGAVTRAVAAASGRKGHTQRQGTQYHTTAETV